MTRKPKAPIAIYSALSDATRCRIIEILLSGAVPVHQLAEAFAISRPAISRHLRVLKEAGLVAEVKKGRENLYALRAGKLAKATAWIEALATAEPPKPAKPAKPAPVVIMAEEKSPPAPRPPTGQVRINQMGFDF